MYVYSESLTKYRHPSNYNTCILCQISNMIFVICLQEEFEDDTAKSLAVCLNFCLIDDLITPCILKDRCVALNKFGYSFSVNL